MLDRIPRRLLVAFTRPGPATETQDPAAAAALGDEVDFFAYGEDCILSGRTILDGDRLTDMLNEHDEYALIDVMVERFDGGQPMEVAELVVPRDEVWMVHASGPRGDSARRHRTLQQHVAIKMGPYQVRGFYHALPGTDPVAAIRRRKAMVPLTAARIEFTAGGEKRDVRVDTVIVNRDLMEWVEAADPDQIDFPVRATRVAPNRS